MDQSDTANETLAVVTARLPGAFAAGAIDHVVSLLRGAQAESLSDDQNLRFLQLLSLLKRLEVSDKVFAQTYATLRQISMLETETLIGLTAQALTSAGPILEVGSYVGGGTIALALGAKVTGAHIYSIDKGGMHLMHPNVPTSDIGGDWRANVSAAGLGDVATLIEENYGHQAVWQRIEETIGRSKAGLLVIDADGHVDRAINVAAPFVAPKARLIIDDYSWTANEKSSSTSGAVDHLGARGIAREAAVIGSGTWFGEFVDFDSVAKGAAMLVWIEDLRPTRDEGMWRFTLPPTRDFTNFADQSGNSTQSHVLLLRNGRLHGRPHQHHALMKPDAPVGFSHWREHLYFSTEGGADPCDQETTWSLVFGSEVFSLIMV